MSDRTKRIELKGKVYKVFMTLPNEEPVQLEKMKVTWDGIIGEKHFGRTTIARSFESRENGVTKGAEILNLRQFTILSKEELDEIAKRLGVKEINPADMRGNIILEGIPNLTDLPPGTRLAFPLHAVLYVTQENTPCVITGKRIQESNPDKKDLTIKFPKEALHIRGLVAMTLAPGLIYPGDGVKVLIPTQCLYI